MALLFLDSFDHYSVTEYLQKWTDHYIFASAWTITSGGRRGTNALRVQTVSGDTYRNRIVLTQDDTYIVGGAFKWATLQYWGIELNDGQSPQVGVYITAATSFTKLEIRRGGISGTVLATGTTVLDTDTWYYIEIKGTINNSTGSCEVRLNGNPTAEVSVSSTDTQATGNAYANAVRVHWNDTGTYSYLDDFYVCDGTGSANNNFLGDVRADSLFSDGAGASTDWTPSTGSNYTCVDESTPNEDTDYVEEGTTGDHDTYTFDNLATTSGSVYGIQTLQRARKDDAGNRSIKTAIRSGTTDYTPGSEHFIGDTYTYYREIFEQDPDTSSAWTISGVNAAEFGPKLES